MGGRPHKDLEAADRWLQLAVDLGDLDERSFACEVPANSRLSCFIFLFRLDLL